jgi:hypothetical protein
MKPSLVAILLLAPAMLAAVQSQADPAQQAAQPFPPNATQKEVRAWITAHSPEAAFAAATREMKDRANTIQVHLIRVFAVSGAALDKLLEKHADLQAEAEALYAKYDAELEPFLSNHSPLQPLQPQKEQKIIHVLFVKFSVLDGILKAHHELTSESNLVFVHHHTFLESDANAH